MAGKITSALVLTLGVMSVLSANAHAERASKALAIHSAKPVAAVSPAPISNTWVCATGVTAATHPVSFDGGETGDAWVMVYRQNGEVVASERVTEQVAQSVPAFDCSGKSRSNEDFN